MAEPGVWLSHRLRPIVLLLLVATEQVHGLGCKNATYRTGVWLQKRNLSRPNRPRAGRLGMLGRGRKTQTPATALGFAFGLARGQALPPTPPAGFPAYRPPTLHFSNHLDCT